jgi:nicotinate dehydrogenase subunit B
MNSDEINDIQLSYWTALPALKRRDFLRVIGGGIVVFCVLGDSSILMSQRQRRSYPTDFNAYLRIGEDGNVTCFVGKIEMGQGIKTSLAQTAAEELNVSFNTITMVLGDTELCPWDMGTFGSMTTRFFGPVFKAMAAEARTVLVELASERLNISKNKLSIEDGVVFERGNKTNNVSYGQLAKGKKIAKKLSDKAVEKAISEFTVIGKPTSRTDAYEKSTGKALYAGDIQYPGMLYAKILRPPTLRARLKSVDTSEAEKIDGVIVVNKDDIIALLHTDPEAAESALELVKAEFDIPDDPVDEESIFDHLLKFDLEAEAVDKRGSLKTGEKKSAETFESTFTGGYVAHACMETHTATANFENGKLEIWISSQTPFGDREQIARDMNMKPENVRVRVPYVGGGFGGKSRGLQGGEAAKLARITGKPVQVFWSREEEFFYDNFRPASIVKIKSGIDKKGKISLWDYNVYYAGGRGSDQFYDVPHNLISIYARWGDGPEGAHIFRTGAWRAPGGNTNTFARESQIDIMAAKAGKDPLDFRLMNTTDKKAIGVLKAVADRFGWRPSPGPSGRGYGMACGIDAGTYVAAIAGISIDERRGTIKVDRVVCAQDMGLVINPSGAILQMEGCITMGLGYSLSEEMHFSGGEQYDTNFDTYELPRFSWVPEIETILIDSEDDIPHGGGEPAIVLMSAIIGNALFDATGVRLFRHPFTPDRVKQAIAEV